MIKGKSISMVSLLLAATQLVTAMPVYAAKTTSSDTNPTSGSMEVSLENDFWYQVTLPAVIDLTYDESDVTYKDKYKVSAVGEISGRYLEIDTSDIDITNGSDSYTLSHYLGDNEQNYVIGAHDGETTLTTEAQSVDGTAKIDFSGVKEGSYSGTASYTFKLVDATDVSNIELNVDSNVVMGSNQSQELVATLNGEDVTDSMEWTSSDESVATVTDGTLVVSDSAQAGDSATIVGTIESKDSLTASASPLFLTANAADVYKTVSFTITIVEIDLTDNSENPIDALELYPGESGTVKAVIEGGDGDETVSWSATKNTGLGLSKNGNTVTVTLSNDIAEGTTFNLVATVGSYSKMLPVHVKSTHVCTASDAVVENLVNATCTTDGSYDSVVYCSGCGAELSRKTVTIAATGHTYGSWHDENGYQVRYCSVCGEKETNGVTVYTISYNLDGGEMSSQKLTYTVEDATFALGTPTRDGYEFTGWTGSNGTEPQTAVTIANGSTGNLTYTANWEATKLKAGLYDADGNMTYTWDELISGNYLSVNSTEVSHDTNGSSLTGALVIDDSITKIESGAFQDCTGLTSVKIPDSVTTIGAEMVTVGNGAFQGCTNLTSVEISDSVKTIGVQTFQDCTSLTSVTIPDSVTVIGHNAFYNCTGLTSVAIPDSVKTIDYETFWGCTSLTSVTIPNSITTIESGAFYGCTNLTSVVIPNGVTSIGTQAGRAGVFQDCTSLKSVEIPDGVTVIGVQAFEGCTGLTSVVIPDSVTTIGHHTFEGCTNLTSVTMSDSVTTIGNNTFSGCTSLTFVVIPDSVTSIGSYAFNQCKSLTTIEIPDNVTTIGSGAFYNCTGLTSLTIPSSVKTIGKYAFNKVPHIYYTGSASGRPWGAVAVN